ncbi:MAG: hypothetical protein AAB906_00210 [Patescibacteria group bacterium]
MTHFTSYAEKKFDILNRHKVFFTREQIEDAINAPEKINKKGMFYFAQKDGIKAVYKLEDEIIKILTFYPKK